MRPSRSAVGPLVLRGHVRCAVPERGLHLAPGGAGLGPRVPAVRRRSCQCRAGLPMTSRAFLNPNGSLRYMRPPRRSVRAGRPYSALCANWAPSRPGKRSASRLATGNSCKCFVSASTTARGIATVRRPASVSGTCRLGASAANGGADDVDDAGPKVNVTSAQRDRLAEPQPAQAGDQDECLVPAWHRLREREQLGRVSTSGSRLTLVCPPLLIRQGARTASSSSMAWPMIAVRTA